MLHIIRRFEPELSEHGDATSMSTPRPCPRHVHATVRVFWKSRGGHGCGPEDFRKLWRGHEQRIIVAVSDQKSFEMAVFLFILRPESTFERSIDSQFKTVNPEWVNLTTISREKDSPRIAHFQMASLSCENKGVAKCISKRCKSNSSI